MLDLEDSIVTADALHGNRKMADAIRERKGDYVLAIKANQAALHKRIVAAFAQSDPIEQASTEARAHGRHERRQATVLPIHDWPPAHRFRDMAAIARVEAQTPTRPPTGAKSSAPDGKMPTSSASSAKCDSPTL